MSNATQPQSTGSVAKHLEANTIGRNPHLFPYVLDHCGEHPVQRELRAVVETQDWAIMAGSPDEAALFAWLMPLLGAKKVLEVGLFRGSTALALALALPADGKVVGLDISEEYVSTARPFWAKAGVDGKIDVRIGPGIEAMDKMIRDGESNTYDFVFIDADKVNYHGYYERALVLLKPGKGVVAVDNCLWGGSVHPLAKDADDSTRALSQMNDIIRADKRVQAMMLPVADGVYMCRKL